MAVLKEKRLCYRCCGPHIGRKCPNTQLVCDVCGRSHLTILCQNYKEKHVGDIRPSPSKRAKTDNVPVTTMSSANLAISKEVILQTLRVTIGDSTVRAFIDSGSQRSYVLKSTAQKLGLKAEGMERVVHSLFGNQQTAPIIHMKYKGVVKALDIGFQTVMELRDQKQLCGRMPTMMLHDESVKKELKEKGVTLTDAVGDNSMIEMLIGADFYATILTGDIVKLDFGPTAIRTELGWTLMGSTVKSSGKESELNTSLAMCVSDATLSQLWELDTLGIRDITERESAEKQDREAKFDFANNITRLEDGRYSVKMPWRDNLELLPVNREVAFKRLEEWVEEGFIERVPTERHGKICHYIPHRAVVKQSSLTTPVRPVFDTSCRVGKAPSLNECLYKRNLQVQIIPELLLRFREKAVGFVSDIRKAFQMITVHPEDRDTMRLLWWKNSDMKEVVEYRHARVMFGATCSPFILSAVLEYHLLNQHEDNAEIGKELLSSFYVDNCVRSESTVKLYQSFRERATMIMSAAKMDLRLWLSNVEDLEDETSQVLSVLGILWNRKTDDLFINTVGIKIPEVVSKRTVLSCIQKVYDPIGFTSPVTISMKILLQRIWLMKLKWDDPLPEAETRQFLKWSKGMNQLSEIRVSRVLGNGDGDRSGWSLHTFTDSSKLAFATVVFLRVEKEGATQVQLLAAQARVAPIKQSITIPKLELMGCLIGARLTANVKKALKITEIRETYWTDSSTALAWIRRNGQWGVFVSNRTKEINKVTNEDDWRHVPGTHNPADLPSRGCSPSELLDAKWHDGPVWLREGMESWPSSMEETNEEEVNNELRKSTPVLIPSFSILDHVQNQHSFEGLVNIMGYVRRFLYNRLVADKSRKRTGALSKDERNKAEIVLEREIQRAAFPVGTRHKLHGLEIIEDDWGLLRVKSRLTYREMDPFNFKYPMLLPGNRSEVRQLIRDTHQNYCHAGVGFLVTKMRNKYWILKARHTIKGVITKCYRCRRLIAKSIVPAPAPLPLDRINDVEPFEVVGIDLAGPLILRNGKKIWLVIYTCAVYRAVHFEFVSKISTHAFISSLRNFIKKYRRPAIIYSDNGTNFRGADNLFRKLNWRDIETSEGVREIQWKSTQ